MAVTNPTLHLTSNGATSDLVRQMHRNLLGNRPGVVSDTALLVSEKSGTPNMSVDVAPGSGFVLGSESSFQGFYFVEAQSLTNVAISAADPTNPRIDLIVARVRDTDYSGAIDAWALEAVTGTPAGSPSVPAVPANSLVLATVAVAASASSITNANITDARRAYSANGQSGLLAGLGGEILCTNGSRPPSPVQGMRIYESDTDRSWSYDGSIWIPKTAAVKVKKTGTQTVAAGNTTIQWNSTVDYETDAALFDFATDATRVNLIYPGLWTVTIFIRVSTNNTGTYRQIVGLHNGSTLEAGIQQRGVVTGVSNYLSHTFQIRTTGTSDFVGAQIGHDASASIDVELGTPASFMKVHFNSDG